MIRRLRMTVAHLKKQIDRRFTRLQREMNARFVGVDQRFAAMEHRFDDMSQRSDARFSSLERHLLSLGEQLESIARRLDTKIDLAGQRLDDKIEWHFAAVHEHERRITDLEKAERLRSGTPGTS
jgi:hypothetical protein